MRKVNEQKGASKQFPGEEIQSVNMGNVQCETQSETGRIIELCGGSLSIFQGLRSIAGTNETRGWGDVNANLHLLNCKK